ncbi:MAG: GAF domain-containing protein [Chloroflexi bacterium]|nr:GAF domain-containing protein [Chloroflexota bacterium]
MVQSSEKPDHSLENTNGYPTSVLQAVTTKLDEVERDGLDINHILNSLLAQIGQYLPAKTASIIVVNESLQVEYTCYSELLPHRQKPDIFIHEVVKMGMAGWVMRKRTAVNVQNTNSNPNWLQRSEYPQDAPPESALCVPFLVYDRPVGVITLHRAGIFQFNDSDLELLTSIAHKAASHIENARLFFASQRQLQIAALLNEASRAINSSLDINEIMRSLLMQMNEFLNAEALSIALVDELTKELVYQVAEGVGSDQIAGLRLPSNQGLSGWVMEHCEPVLVSDTRHDPRFTDFGDQLTGHPTRAMICAPMHFKGEALGTIQAINPIDGFFTEQDLNLLVNLANIASAAIANAQQFSRTQAAQAQYTSLFQDTINPIILTDLNGYITDVNRRASQFLHYGRDDLIGRHISSIHEPGTDILDASNIPGDSVILFASTIITEDGQTTPVEVYAKRTLFEQSEILQWILHDISKHVELEEMRRDLTAMLFHDLQSPLGNVISSLELLSYEIPPMDPDSPLYYMLDIAKRSSERLQTLVRSLLDINRLEAGHPITERTLVDIYDLIDEVREIERPNFEQRRVEFVADLAPTLPDLYLEEDMIRRVLINLIGNALKYSMEGQAVKIKISWLEEENAIRISVCDEGMGIPIQYRQSIFDKFERVKASNPDTKGLGLGLAFCQLAVEAHNGRIWVEDAPGGGAQFIFTLPLIIQNVAVSPS